MGWKASVIIIHRPTQVDYGELLEELGFDLLTAIEDEPFEIAIYPDDYKVYIGTYKDNLLICAPDMPGLILEERETATEKTLNRLFPDAEICSIVLHSVVNLWGYAVIKNGQKIRVRTGNSEEGTVVDSGEPLEEEKELLSKSTRNENGQRTYIFENGDGRPMTEDQVGENFVFAICKRYFGEELDRADDLLFETVLKGYSYGKTTNQESKIKQPDSIQSTADGKAWWKFW